MKNLLVIGLFVFSSFIGCKTVEKTAVSSSEDAHLSHREKIKFQKHFYDGITEKMLGNLSSSKESFQNALKVNHLCRTCYFNLASIYHQENDFQMALAFAQKSNNLTKEDNFWILGQLAQLYSLNGMHLEAAKQFELITQKFPNNERSYFEAVSNYVKIDKMDQALKILTSFESNLGINELSAKQMAFIYNNYYRKPDKALATYQRLMDSDPTNVQYKMLYLDELISLGKMSDAQQVIDNLKNSNNLNGTAYMKLGEISFKNEKFNDAFDYHSSGFQNSQVPFKDKLFWMSEYVKKFGYENQQVQNLSEVLEEYHSDEELVLILRADISNKLGKYLNARKYYSAAAKLNPSDFRTWKKIVELNDLLGMQNEQLVTTETILQLFPTQPKAYIFHAKSLIVNKNFEDALKVANEGLLIALDNQEIFEIQLLRSEILSETGKFNQSIEILEQLIKTYSDNHGLLAAYAKVLLRQKMDLDKALDLINQAIKLHPNYKPYFDIKNEIESSKWD